MYRSKTKKEMLAYAANFTRLMHWVDIVEDMLLDSDCHIVKSNIIDSTTITLYLDRKPRYYLEDLEEFGIWDNCLIKKSNCNDNLVVGLFWGIPYEN